MPAHWGLKECDCSMCYGDIARSPDAIGIAALMGQKSRIRIEYGFVSGFLISERFNGLIPIG